MHEITKYFKKCQETRYPCISTDNHINSINRVIYDPIEFCIDSLLICDPIDLLISRYGSVEGFKYRRRL